MRIIHHKLTFYFFAIDNLYPYRYNPLVDTHTGIGRKEYTYEEDYR